MPTRGCLKEENHLDILDEFAGTTQDLSVKKCHASLPAGLLPLKKEIQHPEKRAGRNLCPEKTRICILGSRWKKLKTADIKPGEDEDLARKAAEQLQNAGPDF